MSVRAAGRGRAVDADPGPDKLLAEGFRQPDYPGPLRPLGRAWGRLCGGIGRRVRIAVLAGDSLSNGAPNAASATGNDGDSPRKIDPVHRLLFFLPPSLSSSRTGEPGFRCVVLDAVSSGIQMEDLENRLAGIGYRGVGRVPECWRVAQIGSASRSPARPRDPAHSRSLRFWLDRLGRPAPPTPYRISPVIRGRARLS